MQTSKKKEQSDDLNKDPEKQVKKNEKPVTIEDLEAKLKKLGLDKDLFVCRRIRDPDKGWKYIIHDIDWFPVNRAIFESYSSLAVSRKMTKIYKERQAVTEAIELETVEMQPLQATILQTFPTVESVATEYGWTLTNNTLYNRAGNKVHDVKKSGDRILFFTNNELRRTILLWKLQNFGEYLEKAFHARKTVNC